MECSVCMKDIFLSNTHARAPQSSARRTIPIGEQLRPVQSVIDCVHASRKWVARCRPILLASVRSLLLAQILPGRRHCHSLFANFSRRQCTTPPPGLSVDHAFFGLHASATATAAP